MAVSSQQVPVGTSATRLASAFSGLGIIAQGAFIIRNRGAATVYIGGPGVTTSNGMRLDPGESFTAELRTGDEPYAVAASGTVTCDVLQVGGN